MVVLLNSIYLHIKHEAAESQTTCTSESLTTLAEINMHQSIEGRLKHPPDFRVSYRFYDESEGGRQTTPAQGYRSDFWYYHELQPNPNSIYIIWPEFEDEQGNVITDSEIRVNQRGTARMWIIAAKGRRMHRDRITVGMKGYFMEGARRVAECEVIEILGLHSNPVEE